MKTAIIIKGNPKYLNKNKELADKFYDEIETLLKSAGYSVSFDPGEPYTQPRFADVWVAHSRGINRLRFASKKTKTVELQTLNSVDGNSPDHYKLSDVDIEVLKAL